MTKKIKSQYKTVIIGSGPAGLSAALRLHAGGMKDFLLLERDASTGGILNQCIHNGFGLKIFREDLTGPEFARRLEAQLPDEAEVLTGAMVSSVNRKHGGGFRLRVHSRELGLLSIGTETVITATGCRERTRENIEVPGTRPAGVFTAGQAQALLNLRHYGIGCRFVIQGSGDIGLIMARRLTIEGFKVLAVFERLPYLSGSIRNKVQCLDHFGIPLHLGRQISEIRGRGRLTSVETSAVDKGLHPVPGGDMDFNCDTVLFAAGLIPELETVKSAGLCLSDRFHPDANSAFETTVTGLFAAGNCLHINDLADSAAEEGSKAAESVLTYLTDRDRFRGDVIPSRPYTEPAPNRNLDADYFTKLEREKLMVCIICPEGCLLSEGVYGCRRGEEYFRQTHGSQRSGSQAEGFRQRVSTTVEITIAGVPVIIPAVSAEEIPVRFISEAVSALKRSAESYAGEGDSVIVGAGEAKYTFKLCRPAKRG
ncbi:MAG: FAD-dependent oxidoreductase [Spirochaetales bacterium]|nr:FAD-dependent oxidoreductase [Spirochaetales bacterium]